MPNRIWAVFLAITPALALAQSIPPATEARISNLEGAVKSPQSAGDNAWMLVSAALALMMTGPGLALFYAGLVLRKNVLRTMMHSFSLMAVVTVVYISSGVSALVCALYLGKRRGYMSEPMKPHSIVISVIGACLLWVGWFGFNAGSALAASSLATSAFVATHFGAAAATLGWMLAEWLKNGKPSVLGAISGAVAGLLAITPASAFVGAIPALGIGLVCGGA